MSDILLGLAAVCGLLAIYGFVLWITGDGERNEKLPFWDDEE